MQQSQQPAPSFWQQAGYIQPSRQTLLHRLTQGLGSDTTQPSTTTVEVFQPLQPDGLNLHVWMYDIINCGIINNCVEAFQKSMPGTRSNLAAIHLLTSSTPSKFHWEITSCPSAFDALIWISNKFQGGHNRAINGEWFRRFTQEGMMTEETLEQYVQRKVALFRSLQANQHPMQPDDLPKYVIEGLPVEFNSSRTSLYAPCAGGTPDSILQVLRLQAHGIGFNDQRPRPDPKAATTTLPSQDNSEKPGGGQGRGRRRCWECGKHGHITRECPKRKKASNSDGDETSKPQPSLVQSTVTNPLVTHNVLSACRDC